MVGCGSDFSFSFFAGYDVAVKFVGEVGRYGGRMLLRLWMLAVGE